MTTVALSRDFFRKFQRVDWILVACAGLLAVVGLAFIASATRGGGGAGESAGYLLRQGLYLAMGIAAILLIQKIEYPALLRHSPALYLAGLLALCAVFATRPINGARSWFDLYFFKLQPSELMKPILILTLAYYLMYRDSYKRLLGLAVPLVLCMVPLTLILKQPDLGTAMVLVPVVFTMLYAAAARLWHLGLMVLCGSAGLVGMWYTVLKGYQQRRVLAWLYPEEYRLSEAWQLLQSEISIGSGGFFGKGWGQSSQGSLNLLPEKHTDFIFAVVSEEGGFLLAGLLIVTLFLMALSGLNIAMRTREPAGRLIAVGIATLLASQALVNTGVALGLLPTTGVTLPFVSYGGSSLLSSCICLGILINIGARQEPVLAKEDFSG